MTAIASHRDLATQFLAAAGVEPFAFEDEERRTWQYWPAERRGARIGDLDRAGAKAAHRLLACGLSPVAFAQAMAIAALDEVLDRAEGWRTDRRNVGDYWVTVFGDPGADEPWGWRYEGHHVSVHVTVLGDDVRTTPLFLGANPARLPPSGTSTVSAPLQPEENAGFALLHALSESERATAVLSDVAPDDIVTRNRPEIGPDVVPEGVPVERINPAARRAATALAALFLGRVPGGVARQYGRDLGHARFGWCGGTEPGRPHYWRLQSDEILLELDNTQDGANHVHTVWRDLTRDFGADLLARHHRSHHGAA